MATSNYLTTRRKLPMKTITAISATLICSIVGIFGFVSGAKAAEASGSGFFITKNGYVATNHHVIEGAKDVKVKDASGSVWDAEVAFTDLANDLAILKVTGDGFKALSIRPSSAVMKGATVFTIGFPNTRIQGTEAKVTQGIVSSLSGITGEPNSFQISVPVQPGNSGGPLLDASGSVVGVVTSKLSATAMLKATGTLPENVNYAVKSNYLVELTNTSNLVADNISKAGANDMLPLPALVAQAEKSVVLVLVNSSPNTQGKQAGFTGKRSTEWKSLTSSASRKLVISNDTITGENNFPAELLKQGAYAKWDLKKAEDIWKGKYYAGVPCTVPGGFLKAAEVKRCEFVHDVELSLVTPNRIEGRVYSPSSTKLLSCESCKREGETQWNSMVWVPAD